MTKVKQGSLMWEGKRVTWRHLTFKDDATFELAPHFELIVTDPATGESVTWDNIRIEMMNGKIETDFTKIPPPVRDQILDDVIKPLQGPLSLK